MSLSPLSSLASSPEPEALPALATPRPSNQWATPQIVLPDTTVSRLVGGGRPRHRPRPSTSQIEEQPPPGHKSRTKLSKRDKQAGQEGSKLSRRDKKHHPHVSHSHNTRSRRRSPIVEVDLEAIQAEDKAVKGRVDSLRLRIKEMEGDGNCMFRALSDQLWGDEEMHSVVRKIVCDYMEVNEKEFSLEGWNWGEGNKGWKNRIQRMRNDGQYGEYTELLAAARAFNWNIKLINTGPVPIDVPYLNEDSEQEDPSDSGAAHVRTRANTKSFGEAGKTPRSVAESEFTLPKGVTIPKSWAGHTTLWLAYFRLAEHYNSIRLPLSEDKLSVAGISDDPASERGKHWDAKPVEEERSRSDSEPEVEKLKDLDIGESSHPVHGESSRRIKSRPPTRAIARKAMPGDETDADRLPMPKSKYVARRRQVVPDSTDESESEVATPGETPVETPEEEGTTPSTSVDLDTPDTKRSSHSGTPESNGSESSRGSTSRASEIAEVEDEGNLRGAKKPRASTSTAGTVGRRRLSA